jgi:Uri superfamily endonuclease
VKGSYILLTELAAEENVLIGKLGYIFFPKAFYAYVGSAMNGLEARLARHLRKEKELHWHIDYLLKEAKLLEIILCPSEQRIECFLAQALAKEFQSIPGFGSSDCKCQSHLYFTNEKDGLKAKVTETINKANIAYKILPERKS